MHINYKFYSFYSCLLFLLLSTNSTLISQNYLKTTVKFGGQKTGFKPTPDLYSNSLFFLNESDTIVFMEIVNDYFWKIRAKDSVGYITKAFIIGDEKFNKFSDSIYKDYQIKKRYRDSVSNAALKIEQKFRDSIENAKLLAEKRKNFIQDSLITAEQIRLSKKGVPLYFEFAEVDFNSIGTPEAFHTIKNISKKTVDAYTVKIYCYDRFDSPVRHYASNSNIFIGLSQDTMEPNSTGGGSWTLHGHENTAKIKIFLTKVHFTDGTQWISPSLNTMSISGKSNK